MEQKLSIEKSNRLFELGVPIHKTSSIVIVSENEMYDVFSIGDLVSLLPREINGKSFLISPYVGNKWIVCYADGYEFSSVNDELIDSLYEAVIYAIENEEIDLKKL